MKSKFLTATVVLGLLGMSPVGATVGFAADDQNPRSDAIATDHLSVASIPDPLVHYKFDGDLLDAKGNSTLTLAPDCPNDPCNSSHSFGSDINGRYWTWNSTDNRGGGFNIETALEIGSDYTIALKFSFDEVTSWRKIIDYKDRASDNGFYYYNSNLQFYPYTGQTSVTSYPAGTVLDLVAVRRSTGASTGEFIVYAVGQDNLLTEIFRANDTNNDSLPHKFGSSPEQTRLGFFYDDTDTSSEATPTGRVYDLRIWRNTTLSPTDLEAQVLRPAAPTGITTVSSDGSVVVSWDPVTGAISYIANAGGQSCTAIAPAVTCTISGLTNGQQVTVSVQAESLGGLSAASSSVNTTVGPTEAAPSAPAESNGTANIADAPVQARESLPKTGSSNAMLILAMASIVIGLLATRVRRA